jgi:hypothetical protein
MYNSRLYRIYKLKFQAINPSMFLLLCAGLQGRELGGFRTADLKAPRHKGETGPRTVGSGRLRARPSKRAAKGRRPRALEQNRPRA